MKFLTLFILCSLQIAQLSAIDIDLKKYKPAADGKKYDTKIIQRAIDDCHQQGGGKVTIPDGTYLIGAIWLRDNVELHLSKMVTLIASTRSAVEDGDYPEGVPAIINFDKITNASLTGFGKIDGRGNDPVYDLGDNAEFRGKGRRFNSVRVNACKDIRIRDVVLENAQTWALRLLKSDGVQVHGVKILSFANHNNDGIDIDSRNVVISDCIVYSEDDALCFKSDKAGGNEITENVTVTNCILATNCNAIKFGTSGYIGYRNITISNCVIRRAPTWNVKNRTNFTGIVHPNSCEMGVALEMVDGGIMENITISNIAMSGIMTPIFIRFGNRKGEPQYLKNILISNIVAESEGYMCSSITGIPGHNVTGITLRDIVIRSMGTGTTEYAEKPVPERPDAYPQNNMYGYTLPAHGLYVRHVENLTFENIQLYLDAPDVRPAIIFEDVSNVRLNNFQGDNPNGELPFIKIIDGRKINISGFRQNKSAPVNFLECTGNSRKIELSGNDFEGVKSVVKAGDDAVIQK